MPVTNEQPLSGTESGRNSGEAINRLATSNATGTMTIAWTESTITSASGLEEWEWTPGYICEGGDGDGSEGEGTLAPCSRIPYSS